MQSAPKVPVCIQKTKTQKITVDSFHTSLRMANGWLGIQPKEMIHHGGEVHLVWETVEAQPVCSLAFFDPMRQHIPSTSTPAEDTAEGVTFIRRSKNMGISRLIIKLPFTKNCPWQGHHPTNRRDPSAQ
eukprot:15365839-Ditylum_brightwellii.AAC.2